MSSSYRGIYTLISIGSEGGLYAWAPLSFVVRLCHPIRISSRYVYQ